MGQGAPPGAHEVGELQLPLPHALAGPHDRHPLPSATQVLICPLAQLVAPADGQVLLQVPQEDGEAQKPLPHAVALPQARQP